MLDRNSETIIGASPEVAIDVSDLTMSFGTAFRAVDGVTFRVNAGSTYGIVGESGSGKSTLARLILGLLKPDSGDVTVWGKSISRASDREIRGLRKDLQVVFQEPLEALDPRFRVRDAVAEPLLLHTSLRGSQLMDKVVSRLESVQLGTQFLDRFPHELSGGQQQRVNIARALATDPKVLVLDEPTASLDVSVRQGVLKLLRQLQRDHALTYVLISHDLLSVRYMCDAVGVMKRGKMVESGPTQDVLSTPRDPYTRLLLRSELSLEPPDPMAPQANKAAQKATK